MKRGSRTSLALATLVLLGGCAALKVQKAGPGVEGVRYFLPQPFLLVTPRADGGVDVEVLELPDPDNEYAIDNWSFMSTHKLDVALTEAGLLTKVVLEADASAVAVQAASSAGEVGAKLLDERAAAEKARKEKLEAARKELEEEKTEVALAVVEKKSAEAWGDDAAKHAAQLKLDQANAKLERALAKLALAKSADPFNDPDAVPATSVAGPVLFRVREDPETKGVKLEVAKFFTTDSQSGQSQALDSQNGQSQAHFQSHKILEVTPARVPTTLDFAAGTADVVASGGAYNLVFSRPVLRLTKAELRPPVGAVIPVNHALTEGKSRLTVTVGALSPVAPGNYALWIEFTEFRDGTESESAQTLSVTVKP